MASPVVDILNAEHSDSARAAKVLVFNAADVDQLRRQVEAKVATIDDLGLDQVKAEFVAEERGISLDAAAALSMPAPAGGEVG